MQHMMNLAVMVQIFLVEISLIAVWLDVLLLPGCFNVSWILLTRLFMGRKRPKLSQMEATILTGAPLFSVIPFMLSKMTGSITPLATNSALQPLSRRWFLVALDMCLQGEAISK